MHRDGWGAEVRVEVTKLCLLKVFDERTMSIFCFLVQLEIQTRSKFADRRACIQTEERTNGQDTLIQRHKKPVLCYSNIDIIGNVRRDKNDKKFWNL